MRTTLRLAHGPPEVTERRLLPGGTVYLIPQYSSDSHKVEQRSVRGSSLPRIDVIEDEMDISVADRQVPSGSLRSPYPYQTRSGFCSSSECEDSPESSDGCESDDEDSSAPSIRR